MIRRVVVSVLIFLSVQNTVRDGSIMYLLTTFIAHPGVQLHIP